MKIKKTQAVGDLKRFIDAKKVDTVLLAPVERTLLARPADHDQRRDDILHPSEMCKLDTCDLAVYYRLIGATPLVPVDKTRFQLQRIFDEGHEIHAKWQGYLAEAKLLQGIWQCPSTTCGHRWWATAPTTCVRCNHVGPNAGKYTNMIYREVPLDAEESHLIVGHADGVVGKRILEIKSIGAGTIRMEAPGLLAQHSYKARVVDEDGNLADEPKAFIDYDGLWKSIKRPLNSHQRQAQLYTALAKMQGIDVDGVVFLYECKWNQSTKEFTVPYNERFAAPLLDKALDLKYAVEKRRPPRCPHDGCKQCAVYENTDYNEEYSSDDQGAQSTPEHGSGDGRGQRRSRGEAGEAGTEPAGSAGGPDPERARLPLGARRRTADGAVRPVDGVGRLPLGAARNG